VTPLILASASVARAAMLAAAGVEAEILPARIDETAIKQAMLAEGASPLDLADKLAELKALRVSTRQPGRLVLGTDQVLVHQARVFDKAESPGNRPGRSSWRSGAKPTGCFRRRWWRSTASRSGAMWARRV